MMTLEVIIEKQDVFRENAAEFDDSHNRSLSMSSAILTINNGACSYLPIFLIGILDDSTTMTSYCKSGLDQPGLGCIETGLSGTPDNFAISQCLTTHNLCGWPWLQ